MATKRIKDLTNTAAESDIASGNYFAIDGSAGTKKLNSTTLLTKTAQNALAGNVAPAFDETRDNTNPYAAGERVTYNGETYIFKVPHYGAWVAGDAYKAGLQVKQFNPSYFEIGLFDFADSLYASGNYRVRSCIGYSLPMKTGDKIICIDSTNCYFWVEATDSSGTKTYTNTPVVTYTASSDVSVIVMFGFRNTDPITDLEDLLRRFVFVGLSAPNEYVSNLVKKEVIGNRALPAESFIAGLSINLTSGNFSSNSNAAVPRTSVHLKAGDFIQLEAGVHHKFGVWKIYDDGTTPAGVSLKNGIIYINKDCECIFEFYVDSGYSLDIDAIASSFRIYSADAGTNKFIATLAKNSCDRIQKLEPSLFHFGYSGVSNGVYSAVYSGFNDIVTDYMAYISLKANDVVRVVDSRYKFRVVRAAVGGSPAQGSFSTGFYIVPSDVDCWICIERVDGTAFSDEELITAPSCIEIISVYPKRCAEIKNSICAAIARKNNFDAHPSKIRLAAHRGETGVAPENTLPAFIAARNNGYDYIETDVQFTSDGVAMILHDETIDRTSNGSGKLYELTYAQVRAYDFGSWKDARFTGVKIPTLEETLLLCKNIGLGIYLEFKPFGPYTFDSTEIETIIKLVEKYGMADNVLYAGRSDIVHALRPKASVVLGGNAITQPTIVSQALAVKGTNRVEVWGQVSDTFTESVVNELAENDIKLGAWTSAAQNTTDILRAIPKCVETMVTNTIDARALFANMSLHGWS